MIRFLLLLFFFSPLFAPAEPFVLHEINPLYSDDELVELWNSLSDLKNPSVQDFLKIQDYLKYGRRPYLDVIFDPLIAKGIVKPEEFDRSATIANRMLQRTNLIGPGQEMPVFGTKRLGGVSAEDRNRCIILYGSYNITYNQWNEYNYYTDRLLSLIDVLEQNGYKGHVLYHLGGYPLIGKGGLRLVHVPYSFKVLAFIEASQLGYDNVLWLDVSMQPTNNLAEVFSMIESQGSLLISNGVNLDYDFNFYVPILPHTAVHATDVNPDDLSKIPHVIATIIGISFSHASNHQLVAEWLRLTSLTYPAMTLYPEEFLLSIASWRMLKKPNANVWDMFDVRSVVPIKPVNGTKPFWFDKG